MKQNNIIIIALFIISAFSSLYAQNALIEVQSAVDTAEIYIGDRLNYSITIKHDKNLRIEQPGQGLHLGAFEIKDYNFSEPQEDAGVITQKYEYFISVFDTGKYTIPAYPIAYFPDTTNNYKIIEAAPIDIFVKSILSGDEAPQLKDIKPPIDIPVDWMLMIILLALFIALAVSVYFGYKAWKKKKEKGFIFVAPPKPKPAHETALKALQNLYMTDLLEKGEFKIFFSKLSEILRIYLEARYFISALEETTYEIMRDLEKHLDEEKQSRLRTILELSDLVKFAKLIPSEENINSAKQESLLFIEQTKLLFKEENGMEQDKPVAIEKLEQQKEEKVD